MTLTSIKIKLLLGVIAFSLITACSSPNNTSEINTNSENPAIDEDVLQTMPKESIYGSKLLKIIIGDN
jgi:hypothetical protein